MDFIHRKPKPRPFAADSTGRPRGTLKLARIGRVQVYEAIGEAREIFDIELSYAIVSHLNDNSDKLQDSASFVDLSLFMMGKSPDRTKPVVMFVSDDKQVRTEAFRMIKKSGIMKDYPDFGFGEMNLKAEFENLQPLGSQTDFATVRALGARPTSFVVPEESIEVFATDTAFWLSWYEGRQLQVKAQTGSATKTTLAAAGGVVSYKGSYMLHSVHHFLPAARGGQSDAIRRTSLTPEASGDECEVIGLSDDEDEEDRSLTIMSHGITTPMASDSESTSDSPLASGEALEDSMSSHESCENLDTPLSPLQRSLENLRVEAPSTNGWSRRVGGVALSSALVDSAFVLLDTSETSASELDMLKFWDTAIPLESYQEHIETRCILNDVAIKTSTPNGTIAGTLSGTPSFIRLPGSKVFQRVYTAKLNSPPLPGDCGSWVRHAVSEKLFGHIIAGSPTTGLVLVMPAAKVFAEVLAVLSEQEARLQQSRLTPGVGISPILNSRSERAYEEFAGNPTQDRLFGTANGFSTIRSTPPPSRSSLAQPAYAGNSSLRIVGPRSSETHHDVALSTSVPVRPNNVVAISDVHSERPLTTQEAREAAARETASRNSREGSAQSRTADSYPLYEDEPSSPLTAVDARGWDPASLWKPAARGDLGLYNQDGVGATVQSARERTEGAHIDPYFFPPRPSSPSTAPSVCSDTFSTTDRNSNISISTDSSVSWTRSSRERWSAESGSGTQDAPITEVLPRPWYNRGNKYRQRMEDRSAKARPATDPPPKWENGKRSFISQPARLTELSLAPTVIGPLSMQLDRGEEFPAPWPPARRNREKREDPPLELGSQGSTGSLVGRVEDDSEEGLGG